MVDTREFRRRKSESPYRVVGNRCGLKGGGATADGWNGNAFAADGGVTMRSVHSTGPGGGFRDPMFVYSGHYLLPTTEPDILNTVTMKPALEMITGGAAYFPISRSGALSHVLNPGTRLITDPVGIVVPDNADFAHRHWITVTTGGRLGGGGYSRGVNFLSTNGNGFTPTPGVDAAYGTGALPTTNAPVIAPDAILGIPLDPSLKSVGVGLDSIGGGFFDTATATGYLGYIERALANNVGWVQMSKDAATIAARVAAWSKSVPVISPYLTSFISNGGTNDIYGGASLATVQASAIALWTMFARRGVAFFQCTLVPRTTGPWTSAGAQGFTNPAYETARVGFNDWIRDGAPIISGVAVAVGTSGALRAGEDGHPLAGFFEAADRVEVDANNAFTRNGGRWYCGPGNDTVYTDGVHPNALACALLAPSIELARLV